MKKYCVYLLESERDGKFYIGQTNDPIKRLEKHNQGEVRSTAVRRPLKLLGYIEMSSRKEALQIEKSLKSHSDRKLKFIQRFKPEFVWKKQSKTPR